MPQGKDRSSSLTILSLNFFLLFFVLLELRKRNSNNMKIISNLPVVLPFSVFTFLWAFIQLSKMSSAPYPYAQLLGC